MKTFFYSVTLPLFLLSALILMLLFPSLALEGAKTGLLLWFQKVIPSLLPFMILTGLLTSTGAIHRLLKILKPVCAHIGIDSALLYPLLSGLFCGYPMGAKACYDSLSDKTLSVSQAKRLLPCCNLPSPMFLTGYICTSLFSLSGSKTGLVLLSVYLPLPLLWLLGGAFQKKELIKKTEKTVSSGLPSFLSSLEYAMMQSFEILEKIGGYMILFSILSLFLRTFLPENFLSVLLAGSLEMTTGASLCSGSLPFLSGLCTAVFFTVFGGFCIAAQTGSVLKGSGIPLFPYMAMKLLHGILSALLLLLFFRFFQLS